MHVLFVYAHPEPKSFTHALLETAYKEVERQGLSYEVTDLYAQNFNPVAGRHDFTSVAQPDYFHYQTEQMYAAQHGTFAPDIAAEQEKVRKADVLVFIFPLWGGGFPAILKGWFDRALAYGFSYVDGARFERGLFKGRAALACIPTGGTIERFSPGSTYGSIEQVLWPFTHCKLGYLGLDVTPPYIAYAAPRVGDEGRTKLLADWETYFGEFLADRAANHPALPPLAPPETVTSWNSKA